jgi:hypothetical protein
MYEEQKEPYHCPIDFEVRKQNVVECREHGQQVGVLMHLSEIFAVLLQGPGFLPGGSDTWVILPSVE